MVSGLNGRRSRGRLVLPRMTPPLVPTFYVFLDSIGEWRFRFCCDLNQSRLKGSQGYRAKASVYEAIEVVQRNVPHDERYAYKKNSRGKHFCTLHAENGKTLAMSRNHSVLEDLLEDVEIVQAEVPIAVIVEELPPEPDVRR